MLTVAIIVGTMLAWLVVTWLVTPCLDPLLVEYRTPVDPEWPPPTIDQIRFLEAWESSHRHWLLEDFYMEPRGRYSYVPQV